LNPGSSIFPAEERKLDREREREREREDGGENPSDLLRESREERVLSHL